jgi:hypothetical protein
MAPFAWPMAIFAIAVAAFFIFKPAFIRLIDRISRVSKNGGIECSQEGRGPQRLPALTSFDEIMRIPITATVLSREKTIESTLEPINLRDEKQKIAILIRSLAMVRTELEFYSTSATIFGSQLYVLLQLSAPTQGLKLAQLETIFKQAQDKFHDLHKNRTFNEWFDYLLSKNLITRKDENFDITQYGTDFLKYIADAKLAYERLG